MKGKIVLCESIQSPTSVGFLSGAVGVIFGNNYPKDLPGAYALPALQVTLWDLRLIHSYLTSIGYSSSLSDKYIYLFIFKLVQSFTTFNVLDNSTKKVHGLSTGVTLVVKEVKYEIKKSVNFNDTLFLSLLVESSLTFPISISYQSSLTFFFSKKKV